MECERLIKLIKNWYGQVQDEAMAPARMVDFMRGHLDSCPICMADPGVDAEINKIAEIILPAKPPKATRPDDDIADSEPYEEPDEAGEIGEDVEDEEEDEDTADDLADDEPDDLDDDDF